MINQSIFLDSKLIFSLLFVDFIVSSFLSGVVFSLVLASLQCLCFDHLESRQIYTFTSIRCGVRGANGQSLDGRLCNNTACTPYLGMYVL